MGAGASGFHLPFIPLPKKDIVTWGKDEPDIVSGQVRASLVLLKHASIIPTLPRGQLSVEVPPDPRQARTAGGVHCLQILS